MLTLLTPMPIQMAHHPSSALDAGIVYTRVRRTLGPVSVRNEKTGSTPTF